MLKPLKITSLPTRYEPLVGAFGDRAKATFVSPDEDLDLMKRVLAAAESSGQGKILFLSAESGSGKSTFIHSLEIFLPEQVAAVVRLPQPYELSVSNIVGYLADLPHTDKFTVVNFDGREAPYFNQEEYQTFLGALNGLLRVRRDLIVIWPVTDPKFSKRMVALLQSVGGKSAFGYTPEMKLNGIAKARFNVVLEKLLQIADWRLDDAAISSTEIDTLVGETDRIGVFLDSVQGLIAERFDVSDIGITFPTLVIGISSGDPKIRETIRSLRRADSYYIEASRLLMYTKKSNVAEWWANRATDLKSALPHVIALFNAQLVSISASAVVHAVLYSPDPGLKALVSGVRADQGNARRIMSSSELYKYLKGEATDNREYGSNVKDETYTSFERIQASSDKKHKHINDALLSLADKAGASVAYKLEGMLVHGLQTDAIIESTGAPVALEFHHKAEAESTQNKLAIYVLEKLKEYAINYGLATR